MKTAVINRKQSEQGAILAYFIMVTVVASLIASVGSYVMVTTGIAHRRNDMIAAQEYARAGVVMACNDFNGAFTNKTGGFPGNLVSNFSYSVVSSSVSQTVYQRTISVPFTNQTVVAQIKVPAVGTGSKIVASAAVGQVTQSATVNTVIIFGYPAAIISDNAGTTGTAADKNTAQDGNVTVNGDKDGPLVVDGNEGYAALANGRVNVDTNYTKVTPGSISMTNYATPYEVPNFTSQGTTNSLFDFDRFIACADSTTNSYNTNTHNNHFVQVRDFANAIRLAPNHTIEGVVVVDIRISDTKISPKWSEAGDDSKFPYGVNVRGTLFYNFGPEFGPLDKFVFTAPLNVNAANLTGLVATNSTTYPSGYPPVYTDNTKNPTNIDITTKGFPNFTPTEDLPALMYSIGEVDIHGPANVCGVMYTPSYSEIENKTDGQTQYFKGVLIIGQGLYLENTSKATTVVSYDAKALDNLATKLSKGKLVKVAYWE
jgi:hypothetical protein